MNQRKTPRLALALSGGTAKSVAHIGVIQALTEAGIAIDAVAGTSGGSIVGSVYAAGFPVEDIQKLAKELRWRDLARITFPKLGLLNNSGVERFLTDVLGNVTFADLKIPLAIVATDLLTGNKVIYREGRVAQAAMISSSIPNVFSPIEVNGSLHVDGGLVEYLPVETAWTMDPDVVVAVNLGHREGKSSRPRNLLHVAMTVTGIAAQQNARLSETKATVVIRPPTASFPSFDLMASDRLIGVGYEEGRRRVPDIQAALKTAAEQMNPPWWRRVLKAGGDG